MNVEIVEEPIRFVPAAAVCRIEGGGAKSHAGQEQGVPCPSRLHQ